MRRRPTSPTTMLVRVQRKSPLMTLRILVAAVLALMVSACAGADRAERAGPVTLSIAGTNDFHGAVLPANGRGGLALFSGYLKNLRSAREADGAVLVIDAGDMWQGTMESNLGEGAIVVEAYNYLQYTATTIGNHEFDFGPVGQAATPQAPGDDPRGNLKARLAEARFPVVTANILDRSTGQPVNLPNVSASTTVEAAGVRVGIVGVLTRTGFEETIRANLVGLELAPVTEAIRTEAGRLRASGAEVVIVAAHAGGSCREFGEPRNLESCNERAEIVEVARALEPGLVDVIVAGHTHGAMAHEVNGIAIIESFSNGRAFGRVDLVVDTSGAVETKTIHRPQDICEYAEPGAVRCAEPGAGPMPPRAVYEGAPVEADPAIDAILAPAVERVAAIKAEPLGVTAATPLPIRGEVESPLGNLFADAMLDASGGADLVINNTDGGLRADLPAGPLTYGRLFEVFPFDNQLVTLAMTGSDLERILAEHLGRSRSLLGLAGGRVLARCANGRLDVRVVRVDGREIADDEEILVATTDYLATTDMFASVRRPDGDIGTGPIVRDVVAERLRRRGGTVEAATLVNPEQPRFPPRSVLPMTCKVP